jgi:hypothetical protein
MKKSISIKPPLGRATGLSPAAKDQNLLLNLLGGLLLNFILK